MTRYNKLANGNVAVYRAYDADAELLYVGITECPERRLKSEHAKRSRWYPRARRIDIRIFSDRETALRVEANVFAREKPSWPQMVEERLIDEAFVEPAPLSESEIVIPPRQGLFD